MRHFDLKIRRARGFLLIVAVFVLVVVALAVVALGNMTSADIRSGTAHAQSEQAYFAAASGVEYASFQFGPGTACGSSNINNATGTVGQARFTITTQTYLASTATTDNPLAAGALAINVGSTAGFASHGRIWIDAEQMNYSGKTATSFTGVSRGQAGSTVTTHALGSTVSQDQCLVKSTGASGSATRVVEAAIERSTNLERAMLVYAKGTALTGGGFDRNIYYRMWDPVNKAWLAEQTSTQQVANNASPVYYVVRFARTRNEAILGTIDGSGNLFIHVWNGNTNTWSNPLGANTALQTGLSNTNRDFQIAYEYQNDRAMIVYANGGAANPKFAIWDGTTLNTTPAAGGFLHSSLGLGAYVTTGVIRWFRLAANQANGSNEILMLTFDSANAVWGARWTGSSWVKMEAGAAAIWDTTAGAPTDQEAVDVVYQSNSNVGMFVWGDATGNKQFRWRTWTPSTSTLGAANTTTISNWLSGGCANNTLIEWLRVYPRPDTDEILVVLQLTGRDVASIRWDGSAWDDANRTCHDANTETAAERDFDFSWQTLPSGRGKGWMLWGSRTSVGGFFLATQSFTSPAAPGPGGVWSATTRILDRTLGVKAGVLPLTGTLLAALYQAAASTNDDIQGIYADGGAAPPAWIIPAGLSIWGGPTTVQQGERSFIGISPTTSQVLQQQELYP
jgi:Tfp pilus assembly protein PilX